ncbi:MAG: DUF2950 domain-containing protein [Phycisphaerae bacterium]|nr:DUF2950 domain-containing protein [Phycisphaerae bacterium]
MRISVSLVRGILLAAMLGPAVVHAETPTAQERFRSPQAAADALLEACKNNESEVLIRILGECYREHIAKIDDAVEQRNRRMLYLMAQGHLEIKEEGDAKAALVIGRIQWPMPVPLVKESEGWRFDFDLGLEEIRARRIGAHELVAIQACREYVRIQTQYGAVDRDGDNVREYAMRLVSNPGKQDGLYWEPTPDSIVPPSPLASLAPESLIEWAKMDAGAPLMGYQYRILTQQGKNPPGGEYDYIINGNMIAGFALVAWPAEYRESGVMTFVISHQGKLFEKDLGPDTDKRVKAMTQYDPDASWELLED